MRILLISPRPLRPARRGHQLRALQVANALAAARHDVTVLTPGGGAVPEPGEPAPFREVAAPTASAWRPAGALSAWLEGLPAQAGLADGPAFTAACERLAAEADLVVLQLARLARVADRLTARGAPWIADLVDSLALNLERRAALDRFWLRPLLRLEARRLLEVERRLIGAASASWLVCERDRSWLSGRIGDAPARLSVVPIAVEPRAAEPRGEPSGPPVACLTGNLGYFPTREGASWLLREVWPRVVAGGEGVKLRVAGSRPSGALARAVARAGGRLDCDPPSLARVLAASTLALVPLRAGSGVPIKLLEAWAAGVPAVATPWAAAGAGGVDGEDHLAAEDAEAWAGAIVRLATEPELGARLAAGGRQRLRTAFSPELLRTSLESSLAAL